MLLDFPQVDPTSLRYAALSWMSPTPPAANSAPPWLEFPLGLRPYQWQSWRLPIKQLREDYQSLRAFAAAGEHSVAWSSDAADPAMDALPLGPNQWQFTLPRAPADTERLGYARLKVTGSLPAGAQWRLNGQRLYTAANSDFSIQWGATAALVDGINSLSLVCPDHDPTCAASNVQVTAMRAPVLEPLSEALGTTGLVPAERAQFWFDTRSEVAPRQAVWALVELADASKPTMLRWNDGPWLAVRSGVEVGERGPMGGPVYRVVLDAGALRSGSNLLEVNVAPCAAEACPLRANVNSARLVLEISEDADLCLAAPEQCSNALDDNCDGATDDTASAPCDGPDADGCATGLLACSSAECQEEDVPPQLAGSAVDLQMQVTAIDAVFADGSVVRQEFSRTSIHVGRLLTTGATVSGLKLILPPSRENMLQRLVIRGVDGGARVPWAGYEAGQGYQGGPGYPAGRPVDLRSQASDNGRDLTLDFGLGTPVVEQQPIVIVIDNNPGRPTLHALYGCADGSITFPSVLSARNACTFEGVDCLASSGPGAPCDVGPAADPLWGDLDACASGHLMPAPYSQDLVCMGDWPADTLQGAPGSLRLRLQVLGVTWLWSRAEDVYVPFEQVREVDLWASLAEGAVLAGLTIPAPPEGGFLRGVRLHLLAAQVSDPLSPDGWHSVAVGSGPEDSGAELDLLLDTIQPITAERPLTLLAGQGQTTMGPAVWTCSADRWSVQRLVPVQLAHAEP